MADILITVRINSRTIKNTKLMLSLNIHNMLHVKVVLLLTLIIGLSLDVVAKDKYIGKYMTTITEKANDKVRTETCNYSNEFSMTVLDGKLCITVCHELVTDSKENAIKNSKSITNFLAASSVLSSLSSGVSLVGGNTSKAQTEAYEAQRKAGNARDEVEKMKELASLGASLILENTSDEELFVNDIMRGLTWILQPHSDIVIPMLYNDKKRKLRASTLDISKQPISLIDIKAESEIKYFDIEFEDDKFLYYCPNEGKKDEMYLTPVSPKYYRIEKATVERSEISKNEYKEIKKIIKKLDF